MDTLVRNTNLRHSHRRTDGYEPLNPVGDHYRRRRDDVDHDDHDDQDHGYADKRTFSRPRSTAQRQPGTPVMMSNFSYRRKRARQRQIFLQTYKLGSMDTSRKSRAAPKLKKFVVKVKTVVVSVLSFMRAEASKSCNSGSAICASSPSRIVKIC